MLTASPGSPPAWLRAPGLWWCKHREGRCRSRGRRRWPASNPANKQRTPKRPIPATVIVARGWSEEEKRAYRLADNQLATRASWDFELLSNELRDLKFGGFDLGLTGFEPDQLEPSCPVWDR